MALTVDTKYKDLNVSGAYARVVLPRISLDKKQVGFAVWYQSSNLAEAFKSDDYTAPYNIEGANPFVQAYMHIKTLAEFEGATDC